METKGLKNPYHPFFGDTLYDSSEGKYFMFNIIWVLQSIKSEFILLMFKCINHIFLNIHTKHLTNFLQKPSMHFLKKSAFFVKTLQVF